MVKWTLQDYETQLQKIISATHFTDMSQPENDLPFYICPFEPERRFEIETLITQLVKTLSSNGIPILCLNIYDLALEMFSERELLDQILQVEPDMDKGELKDNLQNIVDPEEHLVPRIVAQRAEEPHKVLFLHGVGEVFPYMRSHNLLNNLHAKIKDVPTVIFFPGSYSFGVGNGAALELFSLLTDDQYYRARNIKDLGDRLDDHA